MRRFYFFWFSLYLHGEQTIHIKFCCSFHTIFLPNFSMMIVLQIDGEIRRFFFLQFPINYSCSIASLHDVSFHSFAWSTTRNGLALSISNTRISIFLVEITDWSVNENHQKKKEKFNTLEFAMIFRCNMIKGSMYTVVYRRMALASYLECSLFK